MATETVQGIIEYAFSHEEVRAVIAHTLAQINASNRVLQKVGMKLIGNTMRPSAKKAFARKGWAMTMADVAAAADVSYVTG